MGRVIALGPGGKAQAPERADYYRAVIDLARELGKLDTLLLSPRCRNHEHAEQVRRDLYRSARYYCSCGGVLCTRKHNNIDGCPNGGQRISCRADVVTVTQPDKSKHYHVQYQLFDKAEAIRQVVARYGPDPNQWPYFAKRKKASQ